MRLLVYEFYSAGGTMVRNRGGSLFSKGFSMLNAVLDDFSRLPDLEIFTVLDSRLQSLFDRAPYASRVHLAVTAANSNERVEPEPGFTLNRKQGAGAFAAALEQCEGAVIIAPEMGGLLAQLTARVEGEGKPVLGSAATAVTIAADKAWSLKLFQEAGLLTPKSKVFSRVADGGVNPFPVNRFPGPVVVKPVDGAGSLGITLVRDQGQWEIALKRVAATTDHPSFLVQEYVAGEPVSVSCLVVPPQNKEGPGHGRQPGKGVVLPLTLNRQLIASDNLNFLGVTVPYPHQQAQIALDTARKACEVIPGLAGFVGVDLVLSSRGPVIMEVNPRVTVAYIALREVVNVNLAQYIMATCLDRRLPPLPQITGQFTYQVSEGKNMF